MEKNQSFLMKEEIEYSEIPIIVIVNEGWRSEGWGSRHGARAARVLLSPESRAPRNACIIIMTDADRAAALLICRSFDLAARAGPDALPHKRAGLPLFGSTGSTSHGELSGPSPSF
ncbi:hypothetical protein ACJJTC_013969 [Scirpophaga incertulas]